MPTFTITDVSQNVRDWSSQMGGPMKEYRVHLANGDEKHMNVEWSRKATSPAPAEGQQVEGTLEDRGAHGLKLKVAPAMGGGGFGRPEDPQRAARILRQHSQDMAMRAMDLLYKMHPEEFAEQNADEFRARLLRWADWFDADANKAAK